MTLGADQSPVDGEGADQKVGPERNGDQEQPYGPLALGGRVAMNQAVGKPTTKVKRGCQQSDSFTDRQKIVRLRIGPAPACRQRCRG